MQPNVDLLKRRMDSTLSARLRVCLVRRSIFYVLVLGFNPCLRRSGLCGMSPGRLTVRWPPQVLALSI